MRNGGEDRGGRLMTPRRARQVLLVFLLLALAVAYNALFRQLRPALGGVAAETPAASVPLPTTPSKAVALANAERPALSKEVPDKRGVRAVRAKPEWARWDATGTSVVAPKSDAAGPDTVRAIQRELRQRGYGNLTGDG